MVRHLILANSGTENDVDDIFQETMIVLYRKVREKDFKLTCNLPTYIYSIARLLWLKELENRRKKIVDTKQVNDWEYVDPKDLLSVLEANEKQKLFHKVFEQLTEDCKKVLQMFLNGVTIKEITKKMGYSSDQHTKNRRFRCKKTLITKIRQTAEFKELGYEVYQNDRDIPRW